MSRILCIDNGLANMGVAVMEKADDGAWIPILMRCYKTSGDRALAHLRQADELARRCAEQARNLRDVIRAYRIKRMVAEVPQGGASYDAVVHMNIAYGMLIAAAEFSDLAVEWYGPSETRRAAGVPFRLPGKGRGRELKKMIVAAMEKIYPALADLGPFDQREHIADALTVFEAAQSGNLVRGA